jgi:RimJ/RimL family protein N-acetyltransferase
MKKFWGTGYATEAASVSPQHGFTELHLQKIIGRALPANLASIKVLEKCGMQYGGEEIIDGHFQKTYYSINPAVQS